MATPATGPRVPPRRRSLGAAIKARRQELGLTQEMLAAHMVARGDRTIWQSDISRLERDAVRLPRQPRFRTLAAALELSIRELLDRAGWLDGDVLRTTNVISDCSPLAGATGVGGIACFSAPIPASPAPANLPGPAVPSAPRSPAGRDALAETLGLNRRGYRSESHRREPTSTFSICSSG
jgi:transcriptional regulator with XRE-family HTH domain